MYIAELLTTFHSALKQTFDDEYPVAEFRQLTIGLDFPTQKAGYPGIWLDFEPQELEVAGVGHEEMIEQDDGSGLKHRRWRFTGRVSMTIVSLASLERFKLFDEVVRIIAFGDTANSRRQFRSIIENSPYIAVSADWDRIRQSGAAVTTGTPWDTDEQIYELTVSMAIQGEFVSDNMTGSLAPLAAIEVVGYSETVTPPADPPSDGWV